MSATTDSHWPTRVLDLPSGVRVRTYDLGRGPAVILLHGNPDQADEWRPLMDLLREECRCIAPDLPGYGPRGQTFPLPASFDYSVDAQVRFVDDVLAALGVSEPVTLVVHDIGGIMGVPWAARNLSRVKGVVYTNTVAFPRFGWFPLARLFGAQSAAGRFLAARNMDLLGTLDGAIFRRQFAQQNPQLPAEHVERMTQDFALNAEAKNTALRQFRQITRTDFFDGYDRMTEAIAQSVPTEAVWGDGDPYLSRSLAPLLNARKLELLPQAGHWVPITAAPQVAAAIRR